MSTDNAALLAQLGGMSAATEGSTEATETNDEPVDLDALLNQSLNDIPDQPDFVVPKVGAYMIMVKEIDRNGVINDKKAIKFLYSIVEALEIKGTEGDDVKTGDVFGEAFFVNTQKGAAFVAGHLKKLLNPVELRMNTHSLGESMAAFKGCTVAAVITHRRDKNDKTKVYPQVKKIMFTD